MHSDPENLKKMIEKVQKYLTTLHWKQSQWCALSVIKCKKLYQFNYLLTKFKILNGSPILILINCIIVKNKILYRQANLIIIQKNVRMHLSKIKHRPRYMGIKKINSLKVS